MLALRGKVERGELRVGALVGHHHQLGGTLDAVDANPSDNLALGLLDVGVPRSDYHVHRVDRLGAEGKCGDRLRTPREVDVVHTA